MSSGLFSYCPINYLILSIWQYACSGQSCRSLAQDTEALWPPWFLFSWPSSTLLLALGLETCLRFRQPKRGRNKEKETGKVYCYQPGARASSWKRQSAVSLEIWYSRVHHFQFPRRSNLMGGFAFMFLSVWLFMATWYMTCWFFWSIVITFYVFKHMPFPWSWLLSLLPWILQPSSWSPCLEFCPLN